MHKTDIQKRDFGSLLLISDELKMQGYHILNHENSFIVI